MSSSRFVTIFLSAVVAFAASACADQETRATMSDSAGDDRRTGGASPEMEPSSPKPPPTVEPDAATPNFVDALAFFATPEEIDTWFALLAELRRDFDEVCGDTFCEGDFSNYESLRFRCSVEESTGIVGSCVWIFGASNEEIEPSTGGMLVDGQVFTCAMPLAPATPIRDFVAALSAAGDEPIRAQLPGTDRTPFDGLADCL